MTWVWTDDGHHRFVGGATHNGRHYAKDYESAAAYPDQRKIPFRDLRGLPRAVATYPPKRQIDGVRLSEREFAMVKMLSCKSRVVFWLYHKFRWPARAVAEAYGTAIIDQHEVYIRHRAIKRLTAGIAKTDKRIDWDEVRTMYDEGSSFEELAEFYGLNLEVVRRNLRA